MNSCELLYVRAQVAKNPYKPGVGTRPPFLAGRDAQLRRFGRLLEDYPEKRGNLRITGLRGVGKTVLLKEFERMAKREGWVVVRRDLSARLCDEEVFALAMADYLRDAVDQLSVVARVKGKVTDVARAAIGQVTVDLGGGVTMSAGPARAETTSVLEDRLAAALKTVGAAAKQRGVAFLFDEAHTMLDQPKKGHYPLGALLSAFVSAQDDDDEPLPVMLVLCGLPPLIGNVHRARSNAERLFKADDIANLRLEPEAGAELSDAALALVNPARDSGEITFDDGAAETIAAELDGYPYFIQWFGEALWDAADVEGTGHIDTELFTTHRPLVQRALDEEFFEPRYRDARRADQGTLRVAASLGAEGFEKNQIDAATTRSTGAIAQSLNRLIADNLVYRDDHGVYAYTAPLFGDFLRRRHPRLSEDV